MNERSKGSTRRARIARRATVSSILCFGQTAAAMLWLRAAGPIGWIFAFCFTVESLFFIRLLLSEPNRIRARRLRTFLDRVTRIGLWAVFLFGASAIVIGLDITPASAYLAWFQLVQEGVAGGTLAYMFAVKYAFFGALFGGLVMVGGGPFAVLNLAGVDLLICAVLLGKPGLAAIGLLLFAISVGSRVLRRNPRLRNRAVLATVQIFVVAILVALPLSLFHLQNRLIDDLFSIRMQGFVASVFPNFPFLYNVPGYGYTLESSRIGNRPALTSRPVFQVTAPAGSTVYIRTGVYDIYTGEGWKLSPAARRSAERDVTRFAATTKESALVPTDRIMFKVLIDFYSSLPHTLGTVAFRFPDESVPQIGIAGLGAGFILDAPLRRGSEIVDLVARPSDATPIPVVVGYRGRVLPANAILPPWDSRSEFGGGYFDGGSSGGFGTEFGSVRGGGILSGGRRGYSRELLSSRGYDTGTARPPGEAGTTGTPTGAADAITAPGPTVFNGGFRANDGDADDAQFAPLRTRGYGQYTSPYIRGDGRVQRGSRFDRVSVHLPGLEVPAPKYGLQYGRYVLRPSERAVDLETGDVPDRLRVLAESLGAGKSKPAALRAIRSYLVDNYTYSLSTTTSGPYDDAVSNFLFSSKTGFCVQFASAFVILARLNGIPARYVTGFLANLPSGSDTMTVTGLSAHSWAETWNEHLGWVTQEATPPMVAAAAGDPNVLQQFNPSDSSFTQRQLEALLGGRLNQKPTTAQSAPVGLSNDLSKMTSPLWGATSHLIAAGIVLLALLLLLLRFSFLRFAPLEVRFRHVVRQIARRSKAQGLPDPARSGWREWSRGVVEHSPARREVAQRAAVIIHRSFFAGNSNGYRILGRDVLFLRRLNRRVLTRKTRGAATPRREAPVSSRN